MSSPSAVFCIILEIEPDKLKLYFLFIYKCLTNWDTFPICGRGKKKCKVSGNSLLSFKKCQLNTVSNF